MKQWQPWLLFVVLYVCDSARLGNEMGLLPGKNVINIIPEFLGQSQTVSTVITQELATSYPEDSRVSSTVPLEARQFVVASSEEPTMETLQIPYDGGPVPPDIMYPVQHASLPRDLAVYPLPLPNSDHELMFNVSWNQPIGPPARDFSLEVRSVTETIDCKTPMCYEYNIPGDARWWTVPAYATHVAETCGVRPGCAYHVRLIAHPWDGHTAANLHVELDECVAGVCSCAHSPRLPVPEVTARTVSIQGEIFVNISWTLPSPLYPQRLPPELKKQYYFVSIGKQMVSDAHPAPWFAHTISRKVDADGLVHVGDKSRWLLLPVVERSVERGDKHTRNIVLDVKLLARVNLIDDRGCIGPAGNATAYDPTEAVKESFGTYVIWATLGGLGVLAVATIFIASAHAVKKVLNALRPAPVPAPLEPLRRRPAWLALQLHSFNLVTACVLHIERKRT